jgi:tRNA threonylcarbamoyladenosine biosynthesis protein TsaB
MYWEVVISTGLQDKMNAHDQPCLVIDGSAREGVRVGVLADGLWVAESVVAAGALESTTDLTAVVLQKAHLKFTDIKSYAVCIGPGSMLGIRVSAMAVRTWATLYQRPIYVWESLKLLAEHALTQGVKVPFAVINESRLKRWNLLAVKSADSFEPTVELEVDEVNAKALALVINHSADSFPNARVIDDIWSHLPKLFLKKECLKLEPKPDALNPAADYALWSGERHRRTP